MLFWYDAVRRCGTGESMGRAVQGQPLGPGSNTLLSLQHGWCEQLWKLDTGSRLMKMDISPLLASQHSEPFE